MIIKKLKKSVKKNKANKTYRRRHIEINGSVDEYSKIGDYTYIGYGTSVTKSDIGRYCSIGSRCSIGHGEHNLDWISTSFWPYKDRVDWYKALTQKSVTIKNDVWIGTQAIIRRGITLHTGSVVGANSFVNTDVPEYAIVAGSPARIIGFRFKPHQIDLIKESRWWEYDHYEAQKIIMELEAKLNINISGYEIQHSN